MVVSRADRIRCCTDVKKQPRSSCHGSVEMNPTSIHEDTGLVSGLRIRGCCELWCRLQTELVSGIAVAV